MLVWDVCMYVCMVIVIVIVNPGVRILPLGRRPAFAAAAATH